MKSVFQNRAAISVGAIACLALLTASTHNDELRLRLIKSIPLTIGEPSGITYNSDYSGFWIVDGRAQRIINTDLNGSTLNSLAYKGDDIEAVFFDRRDSTLWITEEQRRDIVHLDLAGKELARIKTGFEGKKNKGFEGIVIGGDGYFYIANEKKPVCIVKYSARGKLIKKYDIDFALDISDLDSDVRTGGLFILSDESKKLFVWNETAGLKAAYSLPHKKYEGVAYDPAKKTFALVNDARQTLDYFSY